MDLRLRTVEDEKADRDAAAAIAAVAEFAAETSYKTEDVGQSQIAPLTSAVADFEPALGMEVAESTPAPVASFSTTDPRIAAVTEFSSALANAAVRCRSCSEFEIDFDLFARSRASPRLETRPRSLPEKPKTSLSGLTKFTRTTSQSFDNNFVNETVEMSTAFGKATSASGIAAGKNRTCSVSDIDFDLFVQSRASPCRSQEQFRTHPQSVPEKSKTRTLGFSDSFQPRTLFFPKPTGTRTLCFPEPSETRTLCFPEPSETRTLCFPEPSDTRTLCFPEPSGTRTLCFPETRPLSFVESSKASSPRFPVSFEDETSAKSSSAPGVWKSRSCSESDADFDVFVQSRSSPRPSLEKSKALAQSLPGKSEARSLSRARPLQPPRSSQTRSVDTTRPSGLDETPQASPQRVPGEVGFPKPTKSPPPRDPVRTRHASMEGQDSSLKDLQHLKKESKTKSGLLALSPVHLNPSMSFSPKKANKGKYFPL